MDEAYAMDEKNAGYHDIPDDDPAAVELEKAIERFFNAHGRRAYYDELISWLAAFFMIGDVSSSRVEFANVMAVMVTVELG